MKRVSTLFARGVVILVGIAALAVCLILLPELAREETVADPESAALTLPFLIGAYIVATPFFVALYQTFKLLHYVDTNKAFSKESIQTLRTIKICSIAFGILLILAAAAGIVFVRSIDPLEDVTFVFPIVFFLTFIASVIAVFVAILQKLLADAVAMKSENDLIV